MKARTKAFALRVIRLTESLPKAGAAGVIGKQLLRSATSVGANYRAARRGKSTADFLHKMSIVEQEADESNYWMELLVESDIVDEPKLADLMRECDEITAIVVSTIRSTRRNQS